MIVVWISLPSSLEVSLEGLRGLLELLDALAEALAKFRKAGRPEEDQESNADQEEVSGSEVHG
jgi:hypothetical protein